jgi:hypothetical protein
MGENKFSFSSFCTGLFAVSILFPITASFMPQNALPTWVGLTDVMLALVIIALMVGVTIKTRGEFNSAIKERSFDIYRLLAAFPLLLLAIFFLFGDRIHWEILLPGLAWRTWVFVYSTPSILALRSEKS